MAEEGKDEFETLLDRVAHLSVHIDTLVTPFQSKYEAIELLVCIALSSHGRHDSLVIAILLVIHPVPIQRGAIGLIWRIIHHQTLTMLLKMCDCISTPLFPFLDA